MAPKKIQILLADDHPIVRKGLAFIVNAEDDMEIIGEASDGREAIEQTRQLRPCVILMDVSMPNMGGIEATRIICSAFPDARIIGLSMCDETEGDEMRKAGAIGFVRKSASVTAILMAIRQAAMHRSCFAESSVCQGC